MINIVKRLRQEPYWVGGSQQQSEGESNNAPFDAADLIERQREALRVARKLFAEQRSSDANNDIGGWRFEIDAAIAAIDAALKEDGE